MSRFRYPGTIDPADFCYKEPQKPMKIIAFQQQPHLSRNPCNPVIMDRAVVQIKTYNGKQTIMFNTFGNLLLMPVNLEFLRGYNFKGGEIVAIEAENISNNTCSTTVNTNAIPIKLLYIAKTWNKLIRNFNGVVTKEVDKKGTMYYMLTEVTNLTLSDPNFRDVNNSLLFSNIKIYYDIVNIMGVANVANTLESFVGRTVSGVYVDYGTEAQYRDGIPIVIIKFAIN